MSGSGRIETLAVATRVPSRMAWDHRPLSDASRERRSYRSPTEAEAKARPSARIMMRGPPRRGGKRTRKIATDRPTPRWSPHLITRASNPSRTLQATSMSSWRARAPTTATPSNTSIGTASSSNAFCGGWQTKGRKRRRSSDRERGRNRQGSGRLKVEVIRPNAYRLKDNNDNILSERLEQLCCFSSPKFQSYHCLLSVCSYKSTPTRTLFGLGRLGDPRGCTTTSLCHLLSYGETPSYPNKRVVRSFNLPYVALL